MPKVCRACGSSFESRRQKCGPCIGRDYREKVGNKCADCGKVIKPGAARCKPHQAKIKRESSAGSRTPKGYVILSRPEHPNARVNGQIFEHILVMSEHIGRPLLPEENVHHKNGDRADNRIENLELWSKSQPAGQRVEDKVKWAREILALYGGMES